MLALLMLALVSFAQVVPVLITLLILLLVICLVCAVICWILGNLVGSPAIGRFVWAAGGIIFLIVLLQKLLGLGLL